MCRYGNRNYKDHYACFECRKAFKREAGVETVPPCPQCRADMAFMGHDFKAPRQGDQEQWTKVRRLHEHGINFMSCGCGGPGFRPARLRDVEAFLRDCLTPSEGERVLRRLAARRPPSPRERNARRKSGLHAKPRVRFRVAAGPGVDLEMEGRFFRLCSDASSVVPLRWTKDQAPFVAMLEWKRKRLVLASWQGRGPILINEEGVNAFPAELRSDDVLRLGESRVRVSWD